MATMATWVDILDFIPFVGSSKSTVEDVVAFCHGHPLPRAGAAADVDAAVVSLQLEVASGGSDHFAGTTLAKSTGKGAMKVSPEELRGMISQASSANKDSCVAANGQRRADKVEVGGDLSTDGEQRRGVESKLSKRGEHVINNGVLKVYKNIIDGFLSDQGKTMQGIRKANLAENSRVNRAYDKPMSDDDTKFIGYKAVAIVDDSYVDANAVKYGKGVDTLKSCCVHYMKCILEAKDGGSSSSMVKMEKCLNEVVTDINNNNLYVDEAARTIWLASFAARDRGAQERKYNEVKERVADMFRLLAYKGEKGNDDVIQWVNELYPFLR